MQLNHTEGAIFTAFGFYVIYSIILSSLAAVLTVYFAPGAAGSGIPELMGVLNGVKYPKIFTKRVLVVKIVGVILAVSGTLCIGKEGPLAHIGAIVAILCLEAPLKCLKQFQTDIRKREFAAAGVSAGVAVAFGAPIGGALFAYEMSTPNTFWTFNLLWRNFFCSAVSTFVLGILTSLWNNNPVTLSDAAVLKFGIMPEEHPIPLYELSGAVIIGFICGVMGSIFIRVNIFLLKLRKKTIKRPWQKVLEVSLFAALTSMTFFMVSLSLNKCIPKSDPIFPFYHNSRCTDREYSPMATLFFNTEGGTIRSLLSKAVTLNIYETTAFMLAWSVLFFTTYGITVPSGVFLPGIIIGLAVG